MSFAIALCLALVLTPFAARLGTAVRLVDVPTGDELKIHRRPVPLTGGLGVFAAAAAAAALTGAWSGGAWGAAGLCLAVGLVDDFRPLPAGLRLLAQLVAGLILVAAGARVDVLGPLAVVTVPLVLVACVNAVNILDGQDGMAGGVAAVAALGLALAAAVLGREAVGAASWALAGALLGFLVWNRPPARVFLGNAGAYAVGAVLAAQALGTAQGGGWPGLAAAGLSLGVFAFELAFTVLRRLRSRTGLTRGDREHSYDVAARRWGRAWALVASLCLSAALAGAAVFAASASATGAVVAMMVATAAVSTIGAILWPRSVDAAAA